MLNDEGLLAAHKKGADLRRASFAVYKKCSPSRFSPGCWAED